MVLRPLKLSVHRHHRTYVVVDADVRKKAGLGNSRDKHVRYYTSVSKRAPSTQEKCLRVPGDALVKHIVMSACLAPAIERKATIRRPCVIVHQGRLGVQAEELHRITRAWVVRSDSNHMHTAVVTDVSHPDCGRPPEAVDSRYDGDVVEVQMTGAPTASLCDGVYRLVGQEAERPLFRNKCALSGIPPCPGQGSRRLPLTKCPFPWRCRKKQVDKLLSPDLDCSTVPVVWQVGVQLNTIRYHWFDSAVYHYIWDGRSLATSAGL